VKTALFPCPKSTASSAFLARQNGSMGVTDSTCSFKTTIQIRIHLQKSSFFAKNIFPTCLYSARRKRQCFFYVAKYVASVVECRKQEKELLLRQIEQGISPFFVASGISAACIRRSRIKFRILIILVYSRIGKKMPAEDLFRFSSWAKWRANNSGEFLQRFRGQSRVRA